MNITIRPQPLHGTLTVIPSKSQAHRLLICAAFADGPTDLVCHQVNEDMEATADCLRALGATITRQDWGYRVSPCNTPAKKATLNCKESGSTLRFLLPVASALGVETTFSLSGRLPQRPLSPLWEELERMGCHLHWQDETHLILTGQLQSGTFEIDGNISSQFITGLLFAAALLPGDSQITVRGPLESAPYVAMTQQALAKFGIETPDFSVKGGQIFHSPGKLSVEGDWSGGAFFLAAKALGSDLNVCGLDGDSTQGDRAICDILPLLSSQCATISAGNIPDLVPVLSVFAALRHGAVFTDIRRLRLKESDRIASTLSMIHALGGCGQATDDTLTIFGTGLTGGTVDPHNDHRIAMSAAIAATCCTQPVTVFNAECVRKSYPNFWEEYSNLGGKYE